MGPIGTGSSLIHARRAVASRRFNFVDSHMSNTVKEMRLEDRFVSAFEMNVGRTLNGTNRKLQDLRKAAIDRFRELGFPSPKAEAWKYTNIGNVLKREYSVHLAAPQTGVSRSDVEGHLIPEMDAHVVVLVNGRYMSDLSDLGELPAGVIIAGLEEASRRHSDLVNMYFGRAAKDDDVFTALNTAFTLDGLFVYVPRGRVLEKPLHVINLIAANEDLFLQPRNLIVFEEGSQARIVETGGDLGAAHTFTNVVTEVFVGSRAVVDMYAIQDGGPKASLVSNIEAHQEGESVLSTFTVTLTGEVVRNNLTVVPDGEHCETHLFGLFLPIGDTHVDNHTLVDHAKPNCMSNELYKGVIDDQGSGVFNGKVFVRRDAQKTNAFQENKTILLSDTATMNAKPELEIYADDVKCSHGATTGQLDREALFYLRSRGIPEKEARGMLLHAFARDVIDEIKIEPLRTMLDLRVSERFGW